MDSTINIQAEADRHVQTILSEYAAKKDAWLTGCLKEVLPDWVLWRVTLRKGLQVRILFRAYGVTIERIEYADNPYEVLIVRRRGRVEFSKIFRIPFRPGLVE